MLSSHRPSRRHNQYIIGYQSGPSQVVFVFMSGILIPQSCLFFHESPCTIMVVTEVIGPPSLAFMGKIQASVCYFGKKNVIKIILRITC